jgi:hypothetical protein
MAIDERIAASASQDRPSRIKRPRPSFHGRLVVIVPCLLVIGCLDAAVVLTSRRLDWISRVEVFGLMLAGPITWGTGNGLGIGGAFFLMLAWMLPIAVIAHLWKPSLLSGVGVFVGSIFWFVSGAFFGVFGT